MHEHDGGADGEYRTRPNVYGLGIRDATTAQTFILPRIEWIEVTSLAVTLVTAAGGGARQLVVELEDGNGVPIFGVAAPGTQAGGLTVLYSFAPLVPAGGSSALGFQQAPFPGKRLPGNTRLVFTVSGNAAGDHFSTSRLAVHECLIDYDAGTWPGAATPDVGRVAA